VTTPRVVRRSPPLSVPPPPSGSDKSESSAAESESSDSSDDSEGSEDNGEGGGYGRGRGRGRGRDRRRGGGRGGFSEDGEPEISDDDVLIPIGGILDVLDNYAFVRTQGYLPGPTDVYVSLGQVKKYNLRKGDAVIGAIRQPREGENQGRQKYNALVSVDSINGQTVDEAANRVDFQALTAVYPTERVRMETTKDELAGRMADVFTPVGKGQRGVIVGPAGSGKSHMVASMAAAVAQNAPDAHLMVVLVDEQPEAITEMQRGAKGEVITSTFDRSADDHTTIAELAIERAKRLVELGHDVVVFLDSLTRLARAYQQSIGGTSRGGGSDSAWVYPTKKLFGAARNVEGGGSLTIIGTLALDTGMSMDDVVASELAGHRNHGVAPESGCSSISGFSPPWIYRHSGNPQG
jgi:transcription termination factor Rho